MDVTTATRPPMTDYPTIFRSYIIKNTQQILAMVQEAETILPSDDREQALHTLSYALNLPEAWLDTRALLIAVAPQMEQAGYRDEWIPYLKQGLEQSLVFDDEETAAELRLQLGVLYQRRSQYREARAALEASREGFEKLGARRQWASAVNHLAYIARMERRFEEAISLVETVHQTLNPADEERAFGYYVLGLVALDKREWSRAVALSKQAFALWEAVKERRMMGRSLLCRGVALQEMEQYAEAIAVNEQAITLFEQVKDSYFKAIAQMNLGIVYEHLEQPQSALRLYLRAEKLFRQLQDQYHLSLATHNMGRNYRQLGQWSQAKAAYRQSIALKQDLGNIALLVNGLDGLGLVYLAEGNFSKAKTIFQEAISRLAQIENEAQYDFLFKMVSEHLQKVAERVESRKMGT